MKKILLVEDEISIADNIRVALEKEGFALTHSKTAHDAQLQLRNASFLLVILDVGLPDRSGFDLCRDIRRSSSVPILFLTARSEEIDKIIGFEIGADDYITKPFSPRELAARIRAIVKRTQEPKTQTRITYGDFEVDVEKQKVTVSGQPLVLSRYEFRLLETLVRRPGVVFTRSQLMELVWDEPDMSLERTVDTHIKSIRAKLEELCPGQVYIQTHRGTGYSLKETE